MNYIRILILALSLCQLACSGSGGSSSGGGGSSNAAIPSPTPSPSPAPAPSPSPSPTPPPSCADLVGTDWIVDTYTLTAESSDQTTPYVPEINLAPANPSFIEQQFLSHAIGIVQCPRVWSQGTPFGGPLSLVWSDTSGNCGAVSNWIQFDDSNCNELDATIRDGAGNVYETLVFKPK